MPNLASISADKLYAALGGVAFAVFLLVLDMIKTTITQWRENRKKAKQSSFVYLAEKQVLLDQATERICLETKADHISLYRLHNGEFFEGNDSIKKMSMVSESLGRVGMGRWKSASQSLLMSDFPHLVLALDGAAKQAYYCMNPDNVLDFEMGRLMNEREYETSVALLIRGKKDKPLAVLMLNWCTDRRTLTDLNTTELEGYRRDLSFTLSD
ncbi:hypothetical protein [Hymenobacter algoricola]|uniref:Uncharacterized protein n=1 Tax=Hymenobacter algoricola TaxID=486267 RepID=A0ABP7NAQ2_9BACT